MSAAPAGPAGEIVAATANPSKLTEIEAIFNAAVPAGIVLLPRPQDLADVDETGDTLAANALLKAIAVMDASGKAALADDTGLEVDALGGEPGVRSARFAGPEAIDAENVMLLMQRLATTDAPQRTARFRTVICLARPDGQVRYFDGVCEGSIAAVPRGSSGFGYDPVFVPADGDGRTFAEMTGDEKHAISHRGRALRAAAADLADFLSAPLQ